MSSSSTQPTTGPNPPAATQTLEQFVTEQPQCVYIVDAKSDLVCRNLPDGRRSCVRVDLTQKEMFEVMQKLDFFLGLEFQWCEIA
ncbi:hypothetical protein H4R33_004928 [Dimargaris cristalligena]|nr:hypothetical protein H4R33_004928 [Dimargaris cristalligena]